MKTMRYVAVAQEVGTFQKLRPGTIVVSWKTAKGSRKFEVFNNVNPALFVLIDEIRLFWRERFPLEEYAAGRVPRVFNTREELDIADTAPPMVESVCDVLGSYHPTPKTKRPLLVRFSGTNFLRNEPILMGLKSAITRGKGPLARQIVTKWEHSNRIGRFPYLALHDPWIGLRKGKIL